MTVQEEGRQLKWSEEGRSTFPDKSFGYLVETFIMEHWCEDEAEYEADERQGGRKGRGGSR